MFFCDLCSVILGLKVFSKSVRVIELLLSNSVGKNFSYMQPKITNVKYNTYVGCSSIIAQAGAIKSRRSFLGVYHNLASLLHAEKYRLVTQKYLH